MNKITYTAENDGLHALVDGRTMTAEEQFDHDYSLYREWANLGDTLMDAFLDRDEYRHQRWEKWHAECKVCHPA